MAEQGPSLSRSLDEANEVSLVGMLRGAALGVILALPLSFLVGAVGASLDAGHPESGVLGCMLGGIVVVVGAFVGGLWIGQSSVMRDWPVACRKRIWREWRRGIALLVMLGLPVAVLVACLAWRDEGLWCLSLGAGLEVCGWFALIGAGVGSYRGEMGVRQLLEQQGYVRLGWLRYGVPTGIRSGEIEIPRTEHPGNNHMLRKPDQFHQE